LIGNTGAIEMTEITTPLRYHVVLNANSGTALTLGVTPEMLIERFEAIGAAATIDARRDVSMADRIATARESDAEVIVAAGGDGTVTALAEALTDTERQLAILPLGTANMLARDLHIPLDIDGWFAALQGMEPKRIDVGCVNGKMFLHKVVIGLIPALAAGREHMRGKRSPMAVLAFGRYFFRRIIRARRMAVEIRPRGGEPRIARVQALAVASNSYAEGLGQFFSRPALDQGHLTLYTLGHLNVGDFFQLTAGMFLGNWQKHDALNVEIIDAVRIRSHRKLLKVMLDGEIETLHTPLDFSLRPQALIVMAPPVAANQNADEPAPIETLAAGE
jgi:diacylglycerol kinase family enzyme